MTYRIVFDNPAARQFRRLSKETQQALGLRLSALTDDPHPPDSRKLEGTHNCYRLRQGDYRVIYTIIQDQVIVLVLRVGHRSDVYRSLPGLAQAIRKYRKKADEE